MAQFYCNNNQLTSLDISGNNKFNWTDLVVGDQTDGNNNERPLDLYINADQRSETLKHTDRGNKNVNILSKSEATSEDFGKITYVEGGNGNDGGNGSGGGSGEGN